jgi:hypothetical protein
MAAVRWWQQFRHWKAAVMWKLGLAMILLLILVSCVTVLYVTRNLLTMSIGLSLRCAEKIGPSDIIVVENAGADYVLFERAAALRKAGWASRVLIPVQVSHDSERANSVSIGIAELMARVAQMQAPEIMPMRAGEPISLSVAYRIRDFLMKEHLGAMIVVTPGFRSKRSALIYETVLARAGITVYCAPVFVGARLEDWAQSWHGIEEVSSEFVKLQFYRFYVLWGRRL